MPVVVVHGGVSGAQPKEHVSLGCAVRDLTGSRLDLVVNAVERMEDDPALNAGYGAVLDKAGRLELDAGIADGATGRCAGVANVTVRHPIALARKVLEETPHVLLTGEGAQIFGADMEQLADTSPQRRHQWERALADGDLDLDHYGEPEFVDTVGALALDDDGLLAAGSSTGGVFGKLPGRVGDAPIFGAGFYASRSVAVMGTGVGELFLRTLASLRVATLVESGTSPQAACAETIRYLLGIEDVSAGLVALDADGNVGAAFHGAALPVASSAGPLEATRI